MYWQCKQGWGLWEWDQARYADMVTGCYWENSVSRQPMVPVCSQMIQQISTSSGRLRPSRRHRRSEDGFCRASMKWELVWLVVFSPVSSWFLYVCFLMFFYHGFFICYRLFLNLSNFCAIHSRWWWQISNAVARESLERQCNLCRPGRESVDSQSESLTKKKEHVQHMSNICPTYVQHMSNICPTLDIIKCQFDCTRTLCDDSDGSDLSFLVTYCHLLSLIVTYCHLLSLIVTYCHLTQKNLRARPLPGNTLARSASWPRSRQNGLERNVGRENTARDDNVMFEKYAHDFGDRPWNNINIYKHLWIVYKRYYDIIIWYIHNI